MSPEAEKIMLCGVTTHQLTLVSSFLIRYEFYAAVQIQMIIKTESGHFSSTNVAWLYVVIFRVWVPG